MVPFKPHTLAVRANRQTLDDHKRVEVPIASANPATIKGHVSSISSDVAYQESGMEVVQAYRILVDLPFAERFPVGAIVHCAARREWYRVVASPQLRDSVAATSHASVLCQKCTPEGNPL